MLEYQEWYGMIYGVFSLILTVGAPVFLNRYLKVRYPFAFVTLFCGCIVFFLVDMFLHNLIFNLPHEVHPLNDYLTMLVPFYIFGFSLILDVVIYFWRSEGRSE